jgi:hypothetical protein
LRFTFGDHLLDIDRRELRRRGERGMRLSPFDPLGWTALNGMSAASLVAGRFEAAIDWAERAFRAHPGYSPALRYKATACRLCRARRVEEARACGP